MLYSRFLPPPSAPPLLPPPFPSPPSCSYSSSSSSSCSSPSSSSSYSTFPLALLPSLLPPSLFLLFFLLIPFLFPFPLPSPPLPAPPPHHHHPPLVCYVMQCDVMLWLFTIWLKLCYILVDWIMCLLIEFCVCWLNFVSVDWNLCLLVAADSHEDGSVRFWDVSTTSMRLIYKLTTSAIFGFETPQTDLTKSQELEDEWPPFRKVHKGF